MLALVFAAVLAIHPQASNQYTVKSGDTCISIVVSLGQKPEKYLDLYNTNQKVIEDTAHSHNKESSALCHWIYTGEIFEIPVSFMNSANSGNQPNSVQLPAKPANDSATPKPSPTKTAVQTPRPTNTAAAHTPTKVAVVAGVVAPTTAPPATNPTVDYKVSSEKWYTNWKTDTAAFLVVGLIIFVLYKATGEVSRN